MIGLDTNVLVRYLMDDDDAQTEQAAALIESAESAGGSLFVSQVVLCELVWVLSSVYRQPRATVQAVLEGLVRASHLTIEDAAGARRALAAYTQGRGDFADYIIRERAWSAGCDHVATFDKKVLKENGFSAP